MATRGANRQGPGQGQGVQDRGTARTRRLTLSKLIGENIQFAGGAGVSNANRDQGFRPAFRDRETGAVYLSRHADGRPAAIHLIEGLPAELVERCDAQGRVIALRAAVEAGFVRAGRFFTRAQAVAAVARGVKWMTT